MMLLSQRLAEPLRIVIHLETCADCYLEPVFVTRGESKSEAKGKSKCTQSFMKNANTASLNFQLNFPFPASLPPLLVL